MQVLITSASRKVSLVKAFQRALDEVVGGSVIAVDLSALSPALYIADENYLVPPTREPEFLDALVHLCKQRQIRLIIPTRDEELPFFAEHRERFAAIGVRVMVPDVETVAICQDKKRFIHFCLDNRFSVPKYYAPADLSSSLEFPLFVKPRKGKGGRNTMQVNSRDDLALALETVPDAIVQSFLLAPEYTIDLFADFAGQVISVVPRERVRIFGGESFVGKTVSNPQLIQEAVRLATELGLIGHNTIQCFLDNDVVKFIEVNPRFGGGANLGFAAGASTPLFLVKLLNGEKLAPMIGEFRDNYVMLRYTEDLFLDAASLTDRKLP